MAAPCSPPVTPQQHENQWVIWTTDEAAVGGEIRRCVTGVELRRLAAKWNRETVIHENVTTAEFPSFKPDLVLGAVANSTWARARHSGRPGPQPIRSSMSPWGFPWLGKGDRWATEAANEELRETFAVLHQGRGLAPATRLAFFHSEDLGAAAGGRPASPWQLRELRAWANAQGLHRVAFFQFRFGPHEHSLPTECFLSHPISSSEIKRGWPIFRGDANEMYIGPLPKLCHCSLSPHSESFTDIPRRTTGSLLGADFISWFIFDSLLSDSKARLLRKGPGMARLHIETAAEQQHSDTPSETTWLDEASDFEKPDTALNSTGDMDLEQVDHTPFMDLKWDTQLCTALDIIGNSGLAETAGERIQEEKEQETEDSQETERASRESILNLSKLCFRQRDSTATRGALSSLKHARRRPLPNAIRVGKRSCQPIVVHPISAALALPSHAIRVINFRGRPTAAHPTPFTSASSLYAIRTEHFGATRTHPAPIS